MSLDAPAQPKGPLLPLPLRVEAVRQETKDTWTLTLERPAGYSFAPGQFDMLYAFGIGEVPISHSGDPADASLIHVGVTSVLGGCVIHRACEAGLARLHGPRDGSPEVVTVMAERIARYAVAGLDALAAPRETGARS